MYIVQLDTMSNYQDLFDKVDSEEYNEQDTAWSLVLFALPSNAVTQGIMKALRSKANLVAQQDLSRGSLPSSVTSSGNHKVASWI